jgi:hypothetical protein
MSSFFDEASLVMIPSGYKDQKVYSIKPLDGSGDLTFSRASSATRVASNGLIEKVRTNLFTYSQLFSNAAWTKTGLTLTGSQTDPNGGTTAFLATATATSSSYFYQSTTTAGCVSVYAKAGTRSKFSIINGLFAQGAEFDLATQTTIVSGAGSLAKIESVGGGWFRCSVFLSSITDAIIALDEVFGGGVVVGQTMSFAFAQHETGDIATAYIATTSAAVSVGPVSGLPRLDYLGSTCGKLLLEPQRTNLATWSEQANQYSKIGATIGSNVVVSPDGYTNADSLIEDSSTGGHAFFNFGLTTFSVQAYTASIFAKKGGRDWFVFSIYDGTQGFSVSFNLNTGVVGSVPSGVTASMVSMGNGWYRCIVTATAAVGTGGLAIYAASADNTTSYAGTNGLAAGYFYGWQLEAAAYATSYIPTLGTSVTRVADAASKTGISSLIGQTEGTIFAEINFDLGVTAFGDSRIQLTDGTTSNWIFIGLPDGQSSNLIRIYVNAPSGSMSEYSANPVVNGVNKIAYGYKSGSFVLYVNGVQAATSSTTLTMATCSRIDLQGAVPTAAATERINYNQVLLFKNRLTNAQLAELTTL